MIKKLIISAIVLTVLIAGKESRAAGVGGFARVLSENVATERHEGAMKDRLLSGDQAQSPIREHPAIIPTYHHI
ncbi:MULTISPECIES: hypothetical protein [unclassified Neorhizobium]|uniref:hypothetical protein n=1 Tax=unclassified Neorhizobium TaxID=2629175 RepID=UPI001FF16107|nr:MULTISPECIES: hypothetical protein [unclassified Neorhizobium]MCJ9671271.1 hypothetical protein [Neorhizobium sp. SHOUNA12B]MCJ9747578.1 hypothetical protein [Neorhizobium sp. SHOUNA12A]